MSSSPRILIIDDEPGITNLVKTILTGEGFEVEQGNNSEEAEGLLRDESFDLIILDLMMPGVSGWDLYDYIRTTSAHQDVPVIILSARIREKEIQDALQLRRVSDYITKPFSVDDLLVRVNRALEQ